MGKTERFSDDLMVFQDAAYAMGLERGKLLEATRADALQQRLTAADERADVNENLLLAWCEANAKGLVKVDDAAYHIITATAEALEGNAASSNADLNQIKAMAARVDLLERDTARYRWLRDVNVGPHMIDRILFQTISDDCNSPYAI